MSGDIVGLGEVQVPRWRGDVWICVGVTKKGMTSIRIESGIESPNHEKGVTVYNVNPKKPKEKLPEISVETQALISEAIGDAWAEWHRIHPHEEPDPQYLF